jgi:hypothetical protein
VLFEFLIKLINEMDKRNFQRIAKIAQINKIKLALPAFPFMDIGLRLSYAGGNRALAKAGGLTRFTQFLQHQFVIFSMDSQQS